MAKMKNLNNFDAEFFGIHSKSAETLDPQLRHLLEVAYEAVVDAGIRNKPQKNVQKSRNLIKCNLREKKRMFEMLDNCFQFIYACLKYKKISNLDLEEANHWVHYK